MSGASKFLKKREYKDHIINILESTLNEAVQRNDIYSIKLNQIDTYKNISSLKGHEIIDLIFLAFDVYIDLLSQNQKDRNRWVSSYSHPTLHILQTLLTHNMKRNAPYTENDLADLIFFANEALNRNIVWIPQNSILGIIEKKYKNLSIPKQILFHLDECKRLAEINSHTFSDYKKLHKRVQKLLDHNDGSIVIADHNWSKLMINDLNDMPPIQNNLWKDVLKHALTATSPKPSQKWLTAMTSLVIKIEPESYAYYLGRWFKSITEEKLENIHSEKDFPLNDQTNSTLIKGLIWSTLINPQEEMNRHIVNLGLYCYKKIPDWGAISKGTGNICIYILGELPNLQSVNALNEMLKKIKYPSAKAMIEKSLNTIAKQSGQTRNDLDELSVPNFGFSSDGVLKQKIGDVIAIIKIQETTKISLHWEKSNGSAQKSPPANIETEFSEEIKNLKKQINEIRTALETQKWRLEKLFYRPESWLFCDWNNFT